MAIKSYLDRNEAQPSTTLDPKVPTTLYIPNPLTETPPFCVLSRLFPLALPVTRGRQFRGGRGLGGQLLVTAASGAGLASLTEPSAP